MVTKRTALSPQVEGVSESHSAVVRDTSVTCPIRSRLFIVFLRQYHSMIRQESLLSFHGHLLVVPVMLPV